MNIRTRVFLFSFQVSLFFVPHSNIKEGESPEEKKEDKEEDKEAQAAENTSDNPIKSEHMLNRTKIRILLLTAVCLFFLLASPMVWGCTAMKIIVIVDSRDDNAENVVNKLKYQLMELRRTGGFKCIKSLSDEFIHYDLKKGTEANATCKRIGIMKGSIPLLAIVSLGSSGEPIKELWHTLVEDMDRSQAEPLSFMVGPHNMKDQTLS